MLDAKYQYQMGEACVWQNFVVGKYRKAYLSFLKCRKIFAIKIVAFNFEATITPTKEFHSNSIICTSVWFVKLTFDQVATLFQRAFIRQDTGKISYWSL